jgi:hypothetical protein
MPPQISRRACTRRRGRVRSHRYQGASPPPPNNVTMATEPNLDFELDREPGRVPRLPDLPRAAVARRY